MRFTELASKEIINLTNGGRLGALGDTDLVIDPETGKIQAIVVPPRSRWAKNGVETEIPWTAVRRVGPEVMIVDMEQAPKLHKPGRN